MNPFYRICRFHAALTLAVVVWVQSALADGPKPRFDKGVEFIVKTVEQFPVVAIADLPACDELHRFLRTLVRSPEFGRKVRNIVVDFGNPLFQPVVDRYLLDGELVPGSVLRHVWEDTTESPGLAWDSPVYAEFFDTLHALNLGLPREQRLRVILADSPVSWRKIQTSEQWFTLRGQPREGALAAAVKDVLEQHERALVIAAAAHLYRRSSGAGSNARTLIERAEPGKFFLVLPQTRFGPGNLYKEIELRE